MTMGVQGFKTKKSFKASAIGREASEVLIETSLHRNELSDNCKVCCVGPDAYTCRRWYAEVTVRNGMITSIK